MDNIKIGYVYLLLLLTSILASCSEVFEVDISNQLVKIITPADSAAYRQVTQTFQWQPLEGARNYRLEVASPSLNDPSAFYIDTLTTSTSLRLVLQAGKFEWRVRALNAGYETGAIGRFFRIDSSSNLAEQSFKLLSPTMGAVIGSKTLTFNWEALPMADYYILSIEDLSSWDTLTSSRFTKSFPEETRTYTWQVEAVNRVSRKEADSRFTFTIDLTAPSAPQLVSPAENAYIQSMPITFSWQRGTTNVLRDSLFLYSVNQTILAGFPRAVAGTSLQLNRNVINLGQGTYYWAVKSVQSNGRTSSLSEKRKLTLLY